MTCQKLFYQKINAVTYKDNLIQLVISRSFKQWRVVIAFAGKAASHFLIFFTLCRGFICRCLAINVQIFRNSALY